jgi:hypothetical protein
MSLYGSEHQPSYLSCQAHSSSSSRVARNGRRIKTFKGAWAAACEAAGYSRRIPHDLRRSAVREHGTSGPLTVGRMQLTRHKIEGIYRPYAITSEADLREGSSASTGRQGQIAGTKADASRHANQEREIS